MIDKLLNHLVYLIVNLFIISICKMFMDISWTEVLIYAGVNAVWMPFLLRPKERDIAKDIKPLADYFTNFKENQSRIQRDIEEETRINNQVYAVYKKDWKLFRVYVNKNQITSLYHFTDRANVKSIIQNRGLYSWDYCLKKGINIDRPGGDSLSRSLDKRYNLENYVRLSVTDQHPMMYAALNSGRITDPVILTIDPELIYLKRTMFSNTNATKSDKEIGDTFEYFNNIKFEIMRNSYLDIEDAERPYYQAEVLVFESIPVKYITNIETFQER